MDVSDKSSANYGTAIILCGIFGVIGIHHFYLRNFLHGIIDLGMFLLFLFLMMDGREGLAYMVLLTDAVHTVFVFYLLITEQARDGSGRLVKLK
jgi:TM2 domain-containing membrane protein YozV